jgi:hypothetical protein
MDGASFSLLQNNSARQHSDARKIRVEKPNNFCKSMPSLLTTMKGY